MSEIFTESDEVDLNLNVRAGYGAKLDTPVIEKNHLNGDAESDWNGASVSPYRAAYMKSHKLSN